jgi:hypothetical protein
VQHQSRSTTVLFRLFQATLCATILVGIASAANFLTTYPKAINLLFEPFSLFLLPGLFVSLVVAGPHDYSPILVAAASLAFYTPVFYALLHWRSRSNP